MNRKVFVIGELPSNIYDTAVLSSSKLFGMCINKNEHKMLNHGLRIDGPYGVQHLPTSSS